MPNNTQSHNGKVNLPKELENPLNESQMLRGFQKYISLRVLRNIRLKLISRLGKVNLFKVLDLLTESHLQRGF